MKQKMKMDFDEKVVRAVLKEKHNLERSGHVIVDIDVELTDNSIDVTFIAVRP